MLQKLAHLHETVANKVFLAYSYISLQQVVKVTFTHFFTDSHSFLHVEVSRSAATVRIIHIGTCIVELLYHMVVDTELSAVQ